MKQSVLKNSIPMLNAVTAQILMINLDDPSVDSARMEQLLKPDRGACAEILRTANSSLYGRSGGIKTLRDAITLMGLKAVKNLIILLNVHDINASLKANVHIKFIHEFGIASALIAYDLAGPFNLQNIKENLFMAGLLHKIGMTIFALDSKEEYTNLLERCIAEQIDPVILEKQKFGIDHLELGRVVFRFWKLPDELCAVAERHNFAPEDTKQQSDLTRITSLTSIITTRLLGLPPHRQKSQEQLKIESILDHYHVSPEKIEIFDQEYFQMLREHPLYALILQDQNT